MHPTAAARFCPQSRSTISSLFTYYDKCLGKMHEQVGVCVKNVPLCINIVYYIAQRVLILMRESAVETFGPSPYSDSS